MFDLTGRTALVTGGSRGLGRAIALALAGQGADLAINYRGNAEAAEEVAQMIRGLGRRAVTIQGDTSAGRDACEAIVKTAVDGLGAVGILVNNAGITRDSLLMRMDADEWASVIDTPSPRSLRWGTSVLSTTSRPPPFSSPPKKPGTSPGRCSASTAGS
ncbi:MAG: SDR family NAD(P)-dependent oxidoreductase [Chloroflexi bacterium]|nr:SDR family NAD(P)-dependent oxidoreductase [Chloroflexota bacterium]